MFRSSARGGLLAALLLAVFAPTSALAADVSLSGGSVHVDEAAGTESNTITIDYSGGAWTVHEAGVSPLSAGTGCAGGGTDVTCTTAGPIQAFVNDAGGTNSYTMNAGYPSAMDGGSGPDTLTGGTSSDALRGHGGNDVLNGGAGSNTLQGGAGGDTFSGGTGSSDYTVVDYADGEHATGVTVTLDGAANDGGLDDGNADNVGSSVNEVDGTAVSDNITGGGTTSHTLYGAGGDDTVTGGSSAGDELAGGAGNDTLNGGPGFDRVSYLYVSSSPGVTATLSTGGGRGTGDTDTFGSSIEELDGSSYADTLTGTSGNDYLKGEGGNDTLDGLAGNDHLYGDADTIYSAPASDDDTLTGGPGNDRLVGNEGNDTLHLDDGEADTLGGGSDCDGPLPSGTSGGADDAYAADAADTAPANCERNLAGTSSSPGTTGGTTTTPTGGGGGPKPTNVRAPAVVGAAAPFKLGARLSCDTGSWYPQSVTVTQVRWLRYPFTTSASPFSTLPTVVAQTATYTVAPADQGNNLACEVTATTAGGSTTKQSAMFAVRKRIKIPASIRGMSLSRAQARLRVLFDGQVSFGTAAERKRAGTQIKAIPCDFGGENRGGGCKESKFSTIEPGQVFNSTPAIGHYIDEAYGSGKLPKIVLDWYDPSKDASDDVPRATPKVVCPARDGANIRGDFENRVLGHYAQYARDLMAQYNCPFSESTKYSTDQTVDPYVTDVRVANVKGETGYAITITAPKSPDLAAVITHVRLSGRDIVNGAFFRGPVDPGLGTDGKLTVVKTTQKNDICFTVVETSTGRTVPGALVRAYDPSGNDVADLLGRKDVVTTGADGTGCGTFSIREKGWYRFTYTYYGSNGTNEEGGQRIEAIDRGTSKWTTMSGREMKCDAAECSQVGLGTGRRAHAASVIDDIFGAIGSFLDGLIHHGSPVIDPAGVRDAQASDGSPSATLFAAQRSNGLSAGVLVVKGDLKGTTGAPIVSTSGSGLITNDGGSLTGVKVDSLITNDGGSLVGVADADASGRSVVKGVAAALVTKDGRIISNDGASLISNDGASLITNDGGSLQAQRGGAVVMVGDNAVIAGSDGLLAKGTLITNDGGSAIPATGGPLLSEHGMG